MNKECNDVTDNSGKEREKQGGEDECQEDHCKTERLKSDKMVGRSAEMFGLETVTLTNSRRNWR